MLKRFAVLAVFWFLLGVAGVAYAQEPATLSGEVTDNSGLVIPGAEVEGD